MFVRGGKVGMCIVGMPTQANGVRSPGSEVIGDCELPYSGARNRTWVLCKIS